MALSKKITDQPIYFMGFSLLNREGTTTPITHTIDLRKRFLPTDALERGGKSGNCQDCLGPGGLGC